MEVIQKVGTVMSLKVSNQVNPPTFTGIFKVVDKRVVAPIGKASTELFAKLGESVSGDIFSRAFTEDAMLLVSKNGNDASIFQKLSNLGLKFSYDNGSAMKTINR